MADTYYTTLIATFSAADDVEARLISETLRENAEKDLEEGDEVWVDDVVSTSPPNTPHTTIHRLKVARNDLIRLKTNDCYDLARELDKTAWVLEQRMTSDNADFTRYDYGDFLNIVKRVLNGEDVL